MRFQVAKRDMEAALQVVGSSVSSSGSDISAHYTFRRTGPDKDDKYGVEVLTYAGRIFSSSPLAAVVVEDPGDKGAFTVENWRLKQWLQHIPADSAPVFSLGDEGEVTARIKRGKQTFQSLDPSTFPHWDKTLKEAEVKARVPADRLAAALAYSRPFASDDESGKPDMCVCEVKDGILYSSDKKAATLIQIKGMDKSTLRVHAKDVGGFLTFLGSLGDGEIEVLEHDRMVLLRGADGATFGEVRFHFKFPIANINMDDGDQHLWGISKAELQEVVGFLVAGAAKEDNRLRFIPGDNDGEVALSMTNTSGKDTTLILGGVIMSSVPKAPQIPDDGFVIDHLILAKVLSPWKDDMVRFGINVAGDKGFVRFVREQFESKFLTVLPWMR